MAASLKFTVTGKIDGVEIRTAEDGRIRAYCPKCKRQVHKGWVEPDSAYGSLVSSDAAQHARHH